MEPNGFDALRVLHSAAMAAWNLCMTSRQPGAFEWFNNPQPGDMVFETSSSFIIHSERFDKARRDDLLAIGVGRLVERCREPWPRNPDDSDDEHAERGTELVWYIRNLDGQVRRWTNANFVRIPETPSPWRVD